MVSMPLELYDTLYAPKIPKMSASFMTVECLEFHARSIQQIRAWPTARHKSRFYRRFAKKDPHARVEHELISENNYH
jgi:hypothetical protein